MDDERAVVVRRTLSISSRVPAIEGGTEWPCVWCLEPTDVTARTPFRPDLGSVPLHLTCGADLMATARAFEHGGYVTQEAIRRLVWLRGMRSEDEPWGGLLGTGEPADPAVERMLGTRGIFVEDPSADELLDLARRFQEGGERP